MAVIASTGKERSWVAALRRIMDSAWFGTSNNAEQIPLALNNESILAVNAAGTGTVEMLKVNASDQVVLPVGITPSAGAPTPIWGASYAPVAATSGTSTQGIANQQWITSLWVPANVTLTGLAVLIGTTGGTDRFIVSLYSNAGVLLANSTTASSGTTVGTAANIQSLAFTTAYAAVGPARYWAAVQISGTTAFIRTVPAQTSVALGAIKTNTVAGPGATITVPSSWIADTLPVLAAY